MAKQGRPPVARVLVECAGCGVPFPKRITEVERSKTKRFFCGDACPGYSPKPRRGANRECSVCGELFYARPSASRQRTCSPKCGSASRVVTRVQVICEGCGGEFATRPRASRRFCSLKCAGREELAKVDVACERCGKKTTVRSSEVEERRFCSRDCFYADQTETAVGSINSGGYRILSIGGKLRLEHRVVMERTLGRPLVPGENVHHVNGQRADNRPANLELWVSSQPSGQRVPDVVAHAVEMLSRYAPERLAR